MGEIDRGSYAMSVKDSGGQQDPGECSGDISSFITVGIERDRARKSGRS